MQIIHNCLNVADAEASAAWYEDNFGFEVAWSWSWETDEGRQVHCYVSDENGMELQLRETEGLTEFERGTAWDHFGVEVDDVDEAFERIDNHGVVMEPQDNPHSGARIAFIKDPDGHHIELLSPFDD